MLSFTCLSPEQASPWLQQSALLPRGFLVGPGSDSTLGPLPVQGPCGTAGPGGELMHFLIRPRPCLLHACSAFQAPWKAGPGALRKKVTFTLICSLSAPGTPPGRAGGRLGQAGPCQVHCSWVCLFSLILEEALVGKG